MIIRSVDLAGEVKETRFDLVVLTVGQRPAAGTSELAEMLGLELNPWGFGKTNPFSLSEPAGAEFFWAVLLRASKTSANR